MAISKKRIYELTNEQTTIVDTDLGMLDKSGYDKAKKFTMLNLYNYIKTKLDLVYQTILVSGTNIKTINGDSILGSGDLTISASDYTYTEVAVSSSELQNMGSTPIELLPALTGGKYYEAKMLFEFSTGFTGYTMSGINGLIVSGLDIDGSSLFDPYILTNMGNKVGVLGDFSKNTITFGGKDYPTSMLRLLDTAVTFTTDTGANPTLGDGTFLVKIWYKERTFGSEL